MQINLVLQYQEPGLLGGPGLGSEAAPEAIRETQDPHFMIGEPLGCAVQFTNDGNAPVEVPDPAWEVNWQPTFTLTGPAHPDGLTFSPRSAVLEDIRTDPEGITPVLASVAPGETFTQPIPLETWAPLREPGDYTLRAALDWRGTTTLSDPIAFSMERPAVQSISLGGLLGSDAREIEGAWLHRTGDHCRLYQLTFSEDRPDLGEVSDPSSRPLMQTGPNATDLLVPWRKPVPGTFFANWYAWREGATLCARSFLVQEPIKLDLGSPPAQIVRPALILPNGELNLFVIAAGGRELLFVRFPSPSPEGQTVPPSIAWRLSLPLLVQSACCALDMRPDQQGRRLILTAQDGETLVVYHLAVAADGSHSAPEVVRLRNAYGMPHSQPGVRIDEQGATQAAILYETDHARHAFAVADMVFGQDGKIMGTPAFTRLGVLPEAPKAAAAAYLIMRDRPARRDWVVVTENNRALSSQGADHVSALSHPVALPLEFVVRSQTVYLLTLDPKTGPHLVRLP